MAIHLITCKGYRIIKTLAGDIEETCLPRLCREAEIEQGDNYAVIAMRGNRIIADAGGLVEQHDTVDPFDLACERRHDH